MIKNHMKLTSFGVNLKNDGGNGHNNGGSHRFVLDELAPDDVAGIDGHFTFGDAPVTRFVDDVDTVVELSGTIRSSSTMPDLFCTLCDGEALCSNSLRSFSF